MQEASLQPIASSAEETLPRPFRLLILEDEATDAELEQDALRTAGFAFAARQVTRRDTFIAALDEFDPDIILVDYKLPDLNGFEAAGIAKTWRADRPVILVTGVLRDDAAMDVVRSGFSGYILKDRLRRLPAAVVAALNEAEEVRARHRAELARDRLAQILESASDAVIGTDTDGTVSAWNSRAADIYGLRADEAIGRPLPDALGHGYTDALQRALSQIRDGDDAIQIEGDYQRADGVVLVLSLSVSAIREPLADLAGVSIIVRDVTEQTRLRRQLEESRRQSALLEERLRAAAELQRWIEIIERISLGIVVVDAKNNTIRFTNEAYARTRGVALDSLIGSPVFDMYPQAEWNAVRAQCEISDRTGSAMFQANCRRGQEGTFPARVHFATVLDPDGALADRIATVFDISAERELEAELRRAHRLEAIGQLTAGVAHDFNNLLQGATANLELLGDEIQDRPVARTLLADSLRIVEHGAVLTRHLLSFARQQALRPTDVDLAEFFREFSSSLSRTLDPRVQVRLSIEPNLRPIRADRTHLQTALLNVAINARDAMPSGGELMIEVGSCHGGGAANGVAAIRMTDTGTGMSPETLAKACEPFFSTKGLNGTGLGLSMVYGFAKQSGGDLHIESELGRGTSVQLWLPLADARPS